MKIAIDPGHGMGNRRKNLYDPGATATEADGDHFAEADAALRYGITLRNILASRDVPVFMTRTSSAESAPLATRASRAKEAGCTHLISLHLNASVNDDANGLEVLYRSEKKDKPLAEQLQDALVKRTGLCDRNTKARPELAVLKFTPGPAVLIEIGFISNADDRAYIFNGAHRWAVCKTIADVLTEK